MTTETLRLMKKFTEVQGTSGHEENVRRAFREEIAPYVDEIQLDGLGGIFGIKKAKDENAPVVMVAAHLDEVGFLVTNITPQGLLKVTPVGGWNPLVVSSQRFTLQTNDHDYPVVSSSIPPHVLKGQSPQTSINIDEILFDAGFSSKEEALEMGVLPGDSIVPDVKLVETANKESIICKSWDNRYGLTIITETLKQLHGKDLPFTLVAGANVQEEVGLRGAKVSTHKFNPDVFVAVDCGPANDLTGDPTVFGKLGEGALVRIFDASHITSRPMRNYLVELGNKNNINYQFFLSKGGTDAGAAHTSQDGVPSVVIGMVARYIHTHQTLFRKSDYLAARAMLEAFLVNLDADKIAELHYLND
nr:glutamyl aminopeptidase [Allofustis seminis]